MCHNVPLKSNLGLIHFGSRLLTITTTVRFCSFAFSQHSLEHAVKQHRRPAIVFAHSMGNLNFLYFLNWLKAVRDPPSPTPIEESIVSIYVRAELSLPVRI